MANFDSDYEIRLATLQALGGDTTRHYDSVYSIDLEILSIIEGGGGGGMDYDAIKAALAASGVTEILFIGNGSGETVTLDYAKIQQIEPFDYAKVQSGLTNTGVTDILFDNGSGATKVLDYDLVNQIGQGGGGDTTNYLCFTSQQDNSSVALNTVGTPSAITLEYSLDKSTWNTWDLSTVTLNFGDTMYLRGNNNSYTSLGKYYKFVMSGKIAASGSIMTLLDSTDTLRTLPTYCFQYLFSGCTSLTTAPILPAINLSFGCYMQMFNGCTSLTTARNLPATTLMSYCYDGMFLYCTSLTTAPELPATNLKENCYPGMFEGCTKLTKAPSIIPATTLGFNCCNSMFKGCTSLTTAPILLATTLYTSCYANMFYGCTSLTSVTSYASNIPASGCLNNWLNNVAASGTFINIGNATYPSGASGIPSGWTEKLPVDRNEKNHIPNKYLVVMTEAEYEALTTKDENTIYYLTEN